MNPLKFLNKINYDRIDKYSPILSETLIETKNQEINLKKNLTKTDHLLWKIYRKNVIRLNKKQDVHHMTLSLIFLDMVAQKRLPKELDIEKLSETGFTSSIIILDEIFEELELTY